MPPVVVTRELECASSASDLWPHLTDTERLNRAIGLGRIQVEPLEGAGAARYLMRARTAGFPLAYEERPYEWQEAERWRVRRTMRGGPMRWYEMAMELAPCEPAGTRVRFQLTLEPRLGILRPLARLNGGKVVAGFVREARKVDEALARREDPRIDPATTTAHEAALARAGATLRAAAAASRAPLADRLIEHVRTASDFDLVRLRPYELADAWGADRQAVLATCLEGVVAGLLELSWDLVCPSCRTAAERVASLRDLTETSHCQLCELSFELDLDRAVEATFRPAPAVRPIDLGPFCIGGPARTPHVVAQAVLPAGGEAVLGVPGEPGRYRVFVRGGGVAAVEARPGAPPEGSLRVGAALEPPVLEVAPGARLTVAQPAGDERHVKLERSEWASRAATAHHVSALPAFRRLFSGEVLRPGRILKVTRVALLFSDLTASTALYSRAGDASAFRLVQEHFDLLRDVIEAHEGSIVKTIGDAVMAAFLDEAAAIRAAVAMQEAFPPFVARFPDAEGVALKLGLHAGPCYAVTANGLLDYFGQTANLAARLQGVAGPGEIVVATDVAERAAAAGWLGRARIGGRGEAHLKGLAAPVGVARLVVG